MGAARVAVVGAGIAGLACATELKKRGMDVVVLERDRVPGGRMNTRVKAGLAFDYGADFLADCYTHIQELAREAGVRLESAGLVRHVFYRGGKLHPMNLSSVGDILRFTGLSRWTRLRLLKFAVGACRRTADWNFFDLSTVPPRWNFDSAYAYACRAVTREFADYIVDPFATTMMFHRATDITAGAFLALFSMMASGCFSFGVQRAIGGMRALPLALARRLDVRTGVAVERALRTANGWMIAAPGWRERFDAIVLACPAPAALRMLAAPTRAQRELLEGAAYSSTIDVSFRIPRDALRDVHCVYVPYVEGRLVSEFTNEAVKPEDAVRGDTTLVNAGLHEDAARELMDAPAQIIFDVVRRELVRVHPGLAAVAAQVVPHDLQRWPHALPRYSAAHVERVRRFCARAQGEGRLWLAGDYMNHPWLEGAALSGLRVAQGVAAALAARSDAELAH